MNKLHSNQFKTLKKSENFQTKFSVLLVFIVHEAFAKKILCFRFVCHFFVAIKKSD